MKQPQDHPAMASKVVPRSGRQIGAWPNCGTAATKGQLISEWHFGVLNFPKKTTQKFEGFPPFSFLIQPIFRF